jgi:hypothetical protein
VALLVQLKKEFKMESQHTKESVEIEVWDEENTYNVTLNITFDYVEADGDYEWDDDPSLEFVDAELVDHGDYPHEITKEMVDAWAQDYIDSNAGYNALVEWVEENEENE